jgi:CRP-like cAMP-binding protein
MNQCQTEPFFQFEALGSAMRFAEEIRDIVNHAPLFESLTFQEINAMCSFMNCYAADRGGVLLQERDQGDSMLLILTGSVDVLKLSDDSKSVRIATLGPGQTIGEMSLVDGQPRFATCIADEPVDFAVLTRAALNEILMMHPRLGNKMLLILLNIFTERLRHAIGVSMPKLAAYAI